MNTYHADIHLIDSQRFIFKDNNYMVFCSDVLTQDRDTSESAMNPGTNTMVFVNKTAKGLTAVYVMYPKMGTSGASRGGITSNSFHVKLIGRARA